MCRGGEGERNCHPLVSVRFLYNILLVSYVKLTATTIFTQTHSRSYGGQTEIVLFPREKNDNFRRHLYESTFNRSKLCCSPDVLNPTH